MNINQIQLWESAATAFDVGYQLVQPEHHTLPTPCSDFDVAALVAHAVGTQIGIGGVLGGSAEQDASWAVARAAMATALAVPDSLAGTIEHPKLGLVSRERLLGIATNDLLIHTWDLARSLGIDDTLPTINLQPAIDGVEAFPPPVRQALFGEPLAVADDASLQERMLAVAGRQG